MGIEDNKYKKLAVLKTLLAIAICIAISVAVYITTMPNNEDLFVSSLERTENTYTVNLDLELTDGTEIIYYEAEIKVKGFSSETSDEAQVIEKNNSITDSVSKVIKSLSKSTEGAVLQLPTDIDGLSASWSTPKEDPDTWIFWTCAILCIVMYAGRYDEIKKRDKRFKSEISEELPNMVSSLCLYLNAGMITDAAFAKLISENSESKNALYVSLSRLREKSVQSNSNLISEIYMFAQRTGIRDFVRVASMAAENASRGSELVLKLENESRQQYQGKMLLSKAKIKSAETKLCFPLMLLLVALVIICVFPALSGM